MMLAHANSHGGYVLEIKNYYSIDCIIDGIYWDF